MGMIGNALALGLVSGANIQDGSVDTADIKNAAVTPAKLSSNAPIWDALGNLGLNTTPSAWTAFKAIELGANGAGVAGGAGQPVMFCNATYNSGWKYTATNPASNYDQLNGVHRWFYAPSGTAGSAITFIEGMRLETNGKLGIGLAGAAPNAGVTVNHFIGTATNSSTVNSALGIGPGGVTNPILGFRWTYSASAGISGNLYSMQIVNDTANANAFEIYTTGASPLVFGTNSTEQARLDPSGWWLLGATSVGSLWSGLNANNGIAFHPAYSAIQNSTNTNLYLSKKTGFSASAFIEFYVNGSAKGNINTNGTTVAYNTSSDYRLKENIAPMAGALSLVQQLKPCTYTWKEDGSSGQGFIAHELQEVVPDAVTGAKDAVDDEGNPKYQGIDTSFLVATLTAALQEQQVIIEQQAAAITALTARIETLEAN